MISLEATYSMDRVRSYIEKRVSERTEEVISFLRAKGVEYTEIARSKTLANKPYTNRTFNLVSSVGFAIVKSGQVVESYFPLMRTGAEGKAKGEATAARWAKGHSDSDDVVLVLVAGEDYASFVQAKEFDVTKMASIEFSGFLNQKWRGF
ncbi:hypothetical protein [Pedobacter faecalis]|uniref:hypothetical protein n=1 Tax=Pedobacter faecalis TaxID=3041495 RepID=UPI00254D0D3F|nr:hypothetical protein [Pedobacter sp. ELA7]